ncbi:MAG TPA: hypothetical protein VGQ29_05345 [Gemmatimonadales bacterium]|jgi:hypothetical protein|nr:hypothetical protein [Gemmatimonadales bacterium]
MPHVSAHLPHVLVLATIALLPVQAEAQRRAAAAQHPLSFGGQVSHGSETDFGVGGRVVFGLGAVAPRAPLEGVVAFDYFFPDEPPGIDLTYWEINGSVAYRVARRPAALQPYLGGGVNIGRMAADTVGESRGSETRVGLSVLGGTTLRTGSRATPFAEARVVVGKNDQLIITGGLRF